MKIKKLDPITGAAAVAGPCLLALLAVQPAQAALTLYDDFGSYTPDVTINGLAYGGTGFAATTWNCNNCSGNSSMIPRTGDLVFTAGGQTLLNGSGNQRLEGSAANGGIHAELANTVSSGVVYISVLVQATDVGTDFAGVTVNTNTGNNGILDEEDLPNAPNDTDVHLWVMRYDLDNSLFDSWVDPVPGSTEGSNTKHDDGTAGFSSIDQIYLRVGGPQGDNVHWYFDELRMGTTFAAVTPAIPEPTTPLLGLAGLLGLVAFRRRRRG